MGTLFNQEPRSRHCTFGWKEESGFDEVYNSIKEKQKKYGLSFDQALEVAKLSEEIRRADCGLDDLDAKDEQIAGIGEIFQDLVNVIRHAVEEYTK